MRYINSVNVSGFRGLKDLTLSDFGDLNILIGASNTGKSSLLEAIFLALSMESDRGPESVIQARSDRGLGLITSLFPKNDLTNEIVISLGLVQSENGTEETNRLNFKAKRAGAVIADYQSILSQTGWTDMDRYTALEITTNQPGRSTSHQIAVRQTDGQVGPRWLISESGTRPPAIKNVSLFLPRELMSSDHMDSAYTAVFRSGNDSEWLKRLKILQPGLKGISPVKEGDGWKIFVRLEDFSLPIMAMGDGFKAASLLLAYTFDPGLVLVDTPEIFQHPKGLNLVSKSIALAISQFGCQVILATQSLEFLDQIMHEAQDTDMDTRIFRFGFEKNQVKVYPPYKLQEAIDSRELIGSDLRD